LSTTWPSGGSNPAKTLGSTTWSDSSAWQRPTTHRNHNEIGHSGTRLRDSSTSTLLSGPCPIGLPLLPLSLQQSTRSFLQQRRWAPKLARRLPHGQTGGGFLKA
jgi:hypothetical protein